MQQFERILGIVLLLQSKGPISASYLAQRFAVSTRTIFRDLLTLSALGVPVYSERGRGGGVRLLDGFFMPPLMFSSGEAIALLLGLTLLRGLRVSPFSLETETASAKLLTMVPESLRQTLARVESVVGIESPAPATFHPQPLPPLRESSDTETKGIIITTFLQAVIDRRNVQLCADAEDGSLEETIVQPLGIFWDQRQWHLVGQITDSTQRQACWQVDHVRSIALHASPMGESPSFDIHSVLGYAWAHTRPQTPHPGERVRLRLTAGCAARLQQDWFYRSAHYEAVADGRVLMTFHENDPAVISKLLCWLGTEAELIEPEAWREVVCHGLEDLLTHHRATPQQP